MTIHCDMSCTRACPSYDGNARPRKCILVNAEVAKLDAERRYYESMTKQNEDAEKPKKTSGYPSKNVEGY